MSRQPAAAPARLNTADEFDAKIVLLGDTGVGKTSLSVRYVQESFSTSTPPTIGASFLTKRIVVDGFKLKLQLWDTAGQERYRSLAPMYYRGAVAAILVFDITSEPSFNKVKDWITELQTQISGDIAIVIVGNKCDLEASRRVTSQAGEELAKSIGACYFEASAKTNAGIEPIFLEIGKQLKAEHSRGAPSGAALKPAPAASSKQRTLDLSQQQQAPAGGGGCC